MAMTPLLLAVSIFPWQSQAIYYGMVNQSDVKLKIDRCFQYESPFVIAKPFDLLIIYNQVTMWKNIMFLYDDLSSRHVIMSKMWAEMEENTDLSMYFPEDILVYNDLSRRRDNLDGMWIEVEVYPDSSKRLLENCAKAGDLHEIDWYYSVQEEGLLRHISVKEYALDIFDNKVGNTPDCESLSELGYDEASFDHLNGVYNRGKLSMLPEHSLPKLVTPLMTLDQFGHWLNEVLEHKNNTSWLHYNMASLFWRSKGDARKSIECSRRAIFHAPSMYRDVALLNLGMTLHKSKQTADAITVFWAAIKLHRLPITNFLLANAYAVAGYHDKALKQYDRSLAMDPGFELKLAITHKHGVLCHASMMKKMGVVKEILRGMQAATFEYAVLEGLWLQSQAALLQNMEGYLNFDTSIMENVCRKVGELAGVDMEALKKQGDKIHLIKQLIVRGLYDTEWLRNRGVTNIDSIISLYRIMGSIEGSCQTGLCGPMERDSIEFIQFQERLLMIDAVSITTFDSLNSDYYKDYIQEQEGRLEQEEMHRKNQMLQNDAPIPTPETDDFQDFDKDAVWPSSELCARYLPFAPMNLQAIYPLFMPFEKKGISIRGVLTDKIGVPANVEPDLPWRTPVCPLKRSLRKAFSPDFDPDVMNSTLHAQLMAYVADGDLEAAKRMQVAEIGHRIHRAMEMNTTEKWIVYTLASLYWRVRSKNSSAINCLLAAKALVQAKHEDIVLTSLASLYLELGHANVALEMARKAIKVNLSEPHIHFIIAQALAINKELNAMLFHYKQVLRAEPTFVKNQARVLLVTWACALYEVNGMSLSWNLSTDFVPDETKVPEPEPKEDVCDLLDPNKTTVCQTDVRRCAVLKTGCHMSHEPDADRVLKILNSGPKPSGSEPNYNDQHTFDPFVVARPRDITDKAGHKTNFDSLKKFVKSLRNGCGEKSCLAVTKEDLGLDEKKCWFEYMQTGYWLNMLTYKQLMLNPELRPPEEISEMPLSSKHVPECYVPPNAKDNFFVWRLSLFDTKAWEPDMGVAAAINRFYRDVNFAALGQMIASYMELHPDSFLGSLAAGWWCGAGGRGKCTLRCMTAAYVHAPIHLKKHVFRSLSMMLSLQGDLKGAKEVSFLGFYSNPKDKIEALMLAIALDTVDEYDAAIWMYRYALSFDTQFLPAKHCVHAAFCVMFYWETPKDSKKPPFNPKLKVA